MSHHDSHHTPSDSHHEVRSHYDTHRDEFDDEALNMINDLSFNEDDPEDGRTIDLIEHFPPIETKVLCHNNEKVFSDMTAGEGKRIDLSFVPIIRVKKLRTRRYQDICQNPRFVSPLAGLLKQDTHVRQNTVNLLTPLPRVRDNSLDVRGEPIVSLRTYPDFYSLPVPLGRRTKRFLRRNRRTILTGTAAVLAVSSGLILLSFTAKSYVESEVTKDYSMLYNLKQAQNLTEAKDIISRAKSGLTRASIMFAPFDFLLNNRFYSHSQVALASRVISGGKDLATTADTTITLGDDFMSILPESGSGSATLSREQIAKHNIKVTDFLRTHKKDLESIQSSLAATLKAYSGIETLGSANLDEAFNKNLHTLMGLGEAVDFSLAHFDQILYALGDTKPMRYAILNQNRDELRADGGFLGSVLTLEVYKGRIEKFEKHDVYDYDWKIYPYKETPPSGLTYSSGSNFGIRDANYYPEFRKTVDKISFFMEKAGYPSVDTMIAINHGLIIDFLDKYGPVVLPEYNNLSIDSKNFALTMSTIIESRIVPYKRLDTGHTYQTPKEPLFRFIEALEKNLAEKRDLFGYFSILSQAITNNEILVASKDSDLAGFIDSLGFRENWKQDNGNWVYPLFTSLSGNKSDRYMKRKFEWMTETKSGCTIINHTRLTSEHTITLDEQIKTKKIMHEFGMDDPVLQNKISFIEGFGRNQQYIRYIVPKWAVLTERYGQDIREDSGDGYEIISFYQNTDPGATTETRFDYTTTPTNCDPTVKFYKQPGLVNYSTVMR